MPDTEPTSEQLHRVVELSSGIRDDSGGGRPDSTSSEPGTPATVETVLGRRADRKKGPAAKLREALSSKEAFQKYYLELSELAISTYKHIGRIRSARCIGIELAKFYLLLGQVSGRFQVYVPLYYSCTVYSV